MVRWLFEMDRPTSRMRMTVVEQRGCLFNQARQQRAANLDPLMQPLSRPSGKAASGPNQAMTMANCQDLFASAMTMSATAPIKGFHIPK